MYIHPAPLAGTVKNLAGGNLHLQDYVNHCCDLLDRHDGVIQALLPESGRRERLLKEAGHLEKVFLHPENRPPLYGALVGVKDIFRVEGFLTRANSKIDPEEFTGPEAESVRLLRQAGALILGKTVTTEFAYFEPGPTRNPHNPAYTPGGSSSGSAAAVAAGFSPLALGTQTIGSVNRPAAYCGVFGFKPSFNRVPTRGLLYFSRSVDHVGYFTQDIEGMILASEALCSNWQDVSVTYRPTLGVPVGRYLEGQMTAEGLKAYQHQLQLLKDAGYEVVETAFLDDIDSISRSHHRLVAAEMALEHEALYKRYAGLYGKLTAQLIEDGQRITEKELNEERSRQKELREAIETRMWENSISLWATPASTGPAPIGIHSTGDPAMNLPWTSAGLPALTIPAGISDEGLPLGLQIVAPFMGDELLLAWSEQIAEVFSDYQS